jgi:tRNA(Ile)-lysidine synthase
MRMSRGSGIGGLGGMARTARLPKGQGNGKGNALTLVRPFIGIPKARLVATVTDAGLPFVDDPSNRDPRFTRSRLRALMPALAGEGLDSSRLAQLASRLRRAEAPLAATADAAWAACVTTSGAQRLAFGAAFAQLPAEIRVRLLGRAIGIIGDEGPVELGKLEALQEAIAANIVGRGRLRRTLAGALVTLGEGLLTVERAPPRRDRTLQRPREALQSGPTSLPGSCRPARL